MDGNQGTSKRPTLFSRLFSLKGRDEAASPMPNNNNERVHSGRTQSLPVPPKPDLTQTTPVSLDFLRSPPPPLRPPIAADSSDLTDDSVSLSESIAKDLFESEFWASSTVLALSPPATPSLLNHQLHSDFGGSGGGGGLQTIPTILPSVQDRSVKSFSLPPSQLKASRPSSLQIQTSSPKPRPSESAELPLPPAPPSTQARVMLARKWASKSSISNLYSQGGGGNGDSKSRMSPALVARSASTSSSIAAPVGSPLAQTTKLMPPTFPKITNSSGSSEEEESTDESSSEDDKPLAVAMRNKAENTPSSPTTNQFRNPSGHPTGRNSPLIPPSTRHNPSPSPAQPLLQTYFGRSYTESEAGSSDSQTTLTMPGSPPKATPKNFRSFVSSMFSSSPSTPVVQRKPIETDAPRVQRSGSSLGFRSASPIIPNGMGGRSNSSLGFQELQHLPQYPPPTMASLHSWYPPGVPPNVMVRSASENPNGSGRSWSGSDYGGSNTAQYPHVYQPPYQPIQSYNPYQPNPAMYPQRSYSGSEYGGSSPRMWNGSDYGGGRVWSGSERGYAVSEGGASQHSYGQNRSQPLPGGAPGPYPMMTPAPVVESPPPMDSAQLLQYMQYHQEMATRAYQSYQQQQQQKQQQLTSPKISASKTNVASSPLAGGEKSKRSSKASSLSSVGKKQSSMKLSTVHQGGSETESEDEGGMTSTQPLTHRTHSTPSLRSGPPPPSILRTTSVGVTTKKGVKFDAEASIEDGKGPMTKRRKEKKVLTSVA
ncbi:hypothetical protein HDU79_010210 [Rhizoclosmatium sp. JEL0117]|nr:hypothetical protein HDU79_010210 [Rhizoclosmatium sp. JEL0117]